MKRNHFPYLTRYLKPQFIKPMDVKSVIIPTDEESAKPVINQMECDISPENLSCDGELSRSQVNVRLNLILRAKAELELILGRIIELEY